MLSLLAFALKSTPVTYLLRAGGRGWAWWANLPPNIFGKSKDWSALFWLCTYVVFAHSNYFCFHRPCSNFSVSSSIFFANLMRKVLYMQYMMQSVFLLPCSHKQCQKIGKFITYYLSDVTYTSKVRAVGQNIRCVGVGLNPGVTERTISELKSVKGSNGFN